MAIFFIAVALLTVLFLDGATCQEEYIASFRGLTEVPDDIPANSTVVSLYYNNIIAIPANNFFNLSRCINLVLGANQLSHIEPGTFNGLSSLEMLYLAFNKIEEVNSPMWLLCLGERPTATAKLPWFCDLSFHSGSF